MPSTDKIKGIKKTQASSQTNVRNKEITPETMPLFKAVKKEDPKIEKPQVRNTKEWILVAWPAKAATFLLSPAKAAERTGPRNSPNANIHTPRTVTTHSDRTKIWCNSFLFCAPKF